MNIIGCKFKAFMKELQDMNPVPYHREEEFGSASNLIQVRETSTLLIPATFEEVQESVDNIFQIRRNL